MRPLVMDQEAVSADTLNSRVMTGNAKPMVMMSKKEKKKPAPTTQRIQLGWGHTGIRSSRANSAAPLVSDVLLTSGSPSGGAPTLDLVKSSLDAFDGLGPNFLDNPVFQSLLSRLPSGFITTLLAWCGTLGELAVIIALQLEKIPV